MSIHLTRQADEAPRRFGARRERAGGAVGVSLFVHALFILLVYFLVTRPAPTSAVETAERPSPRTEVVWLTDPGPGGGGGGGGNRTPAPPARLQTRGLDAISLTVQARTPLRPPRTPPPTPPDPPVVALNLPVRPMSTGDMTALGAVDGPLTAPPSSLGSGSNNGAGTGKDGGSGPGIGPGLDQGRGGGHGGGVFTVGGGVTPPTLLREVRPAYTSDAMRARIQGEVELSAVVRPDGSVTDLKVLRSLDSLFGLDEEAIKAARQWRFRPGTRFGQPVAVYVKIAVGFTMR